MDHDIRRRFRREAKERRLNELTQEAVRTEVQIEVTPLRCSSPELYRQAKKDQLSALRREIELTRLELADLKPINPEQGVFAF